jgi:hypothetical protein
VISSIGSLSQNDYRRPLLRALAALGGSAKAGRVLDHIDYMIGHRFTTHDREWMPRGNDIRWRKKAQWQRYVMCSEGLIRLVSNGVWELTESGWAEAKKDGSP